MTHKVAICGNGTFPLTPAIGAQVVDVLREFPPSTVFLTRGSGPFETFIGHAALVLGYRCFAFKGEGGAGNLERDQELVTACDELVAFLDPAGLDSARTGTEMVIERAYASGKPVRAATVADQTLVWAE